MITAYTPVLNISEDNIANCELLIQQILSAKNAPAILYVSVDKSLYSKGRDYLPEELVRISIQNPRVKLCFNQVQTKPQNNTLKLNPKQVFLKFIIPCWGVRAEIGRMLDSILCQTFTDYHIVCVDDKSTDGTLDVLCRYQNRFQDKITLIRNETNLGAGISRNIGYSKTIDSIQSQYIWVVDGDDYIADKHVLQKIYDFCVAHKNFDIINLGWTQRGEYSVAKLGWPIGLPGRVIKPNVYVPAIDKNIPFGNDVYTHFIMFDSVPDEKIGYLDYNCYIYPNPGKHRNNTDKTINVPVEIGKALMTHKFKKQSVITTLMTTRASTGKWIKNHYKQFELSLETPVTNSNINRKVSIAMASFPFRKKYMLKCIDALFDQCDNFYLWLNEYTEIPPELLQYDQSKLHILLSTTDLKENGRYLFLDTVCRDDYCFICDDDIQYPSDYVSNTLKCFERNGENIVIAYYIHNLNSFVGGHSKDEAICTLTSVYGIKHYRFGLGVTAFIPSVTNFKILSAEIFSKYDIEMIIAQQCVDNNINVISPMRRANFVNFIRQSEPAADIDKYALHLNGSKERTKRTYEYMKSKGLVKNK